MAKSGNLDLILISVESVLTDTFNGVLARLAIKEQGE